MAKEKNLNETEKKYSPEFLQFLAELSKSLDHNSIGLDQNLKQIGVLQKKRKGTSENF